MAKWLEAATVSHLSATDKPGYGGSTVTASNHYDHSGHLIRTETSGRGATLYGYDELGNQYRAGLDSDGNDILEPASPDRITETGPTTRSGGRQDSTSTLISRQKAR